MDSVKHITKSDKGKCDGKCDGKCGGNQSVDKWRYTLYTVLVAILVFNPYTYTVINNLLNNVISVTTSKKGCPTIIGFGFHLLVFTLLIRYLMDLDI